jgi:hypothetical protein
MTGLDEYGEEKISLLPPGFELWTGQLLADRYTDYVTCCDILNQILVRVHLLRSEAVKRGTRVKACFKNKMSPASSSETSISYCRIIQGVSRLVDITAGGDFLGLCDQKSSYKNLSDFGRLRSYGHFLIRVHALVWIASYETSWRVMCSTWWLIICIASIIFATWLAHPATERPFSVTRHLEVI